ncbi:MAG: capsule assembly Wzi family protein [FCB group bacterium]|nr:capsule assembly Wzi family protein [FCB group bacterium]
MKKRTYTVLLILIAHLTWGAELEQISALGRVPADGQSIKLLSELYRSAAVVPPSGESLMTYGDIRELKELWQKQVGEPTTRQAEILTQLDAIFAASRAQSHTKPRFFLRAGLDFLHKPALENPDSEKVYFKIFKDRDFSTRYARRGSFARFGMTNYFGDNLFLSAEFAARDDWEKLLVRDYHYPRNLRDFNYDINRRVSLIFRYRTMKILFGRDNVTFGTGEHGKLLLSDNLPPLDQFRFYYRYGDLLTFNSIIAPVKFYSEPGVIEKFLVAHRLEWHPSPQIRIGISESLVTNQRIRAAYLNPFMIFHNVSDYALKRNMMGALDVQLLWPSFLLSYVTLLIDELDVSLLETVAKGKSRQALGIQAGLKYFEPLGLRESYLLAEFVHLDKWLYNYPYADGTLTYVYEEERFYQGQFIFNRFIGHYLGANADALFLDFSIGGFTFSFQDIHQGVVPIDQPAFTDSPAGVREKKRILGLSYDGVLQHKKFSLSAGLFFTAAQNFHNEPGRDEEYAEVWMNLQHELLSW